MHAQIIHAGHLGVKCLTALRNAAYLSHMQKVVTRIPVFFRTTEPKIKIRREHSIGPRSAEPHLKFKGYSRRSGVKGHQGTTRRELL